MVGDNFFDKEQVFVYNVWQRNYYFNINRAQGQVNNGSNIINISKNMSAFFYIFIVLSSAIIPPDNGNAREG